MVVQIAELVDGIGKSGSPGHSPAGELRDRSGSPTIRVTIKGWQPQTVVGLKSKSLPWQTAAHCVTTRSATRPRRGIQSFFDLPLITGRPRLARQELLQGRPRPDARIGRVIQWRLVVVEQSRAIPVQSERGWCMHAGGSAAGDCSHWYGLILNQGGPGSKRVLDKSRWRRGVREEADQCRPAAVSARLGSHRHQGPAAGRVGSRASGSCDGRGNCRPGPSISRRRSGARKRTPRLAVLAVTVGEAIHNTQI